METAHDFNDRTPLLEDESISNEHRHLYVISEGSNERTPPEENFLSNGHGPLEGNCATSNTSIIRTQFPPSEQGTSGSDTSLQTDSYPSSSGQGTNEVTLEEIAQALCSAWHQNWERKSRVSQDYFTTKELYAMHLAWMNVTRGKRCPFPAPTIVEAVAMAVARRGAIPVDTESPNYVLQVTTDRCTLAVGLLRAWERITGGVGFPVRYIETVVENPEEQSFDATERWHRHQVELYDKFHDFILSRRFQCILHTLLISWPIFILVVGSKYKDCPVTHLLSYLLISLGCVGCLAIFVRQVLMNVMFYAQYSYDWFREWVGLRLIELIFLIVFIVQTLHFFDTYPMAKPGPKQCAQNFYNAALVVNYVSSPLVSMYLFAYLVIICANRFDFWRLIFRHL